jgi:hypothetical protein
MYFPNSHQEWVLLLLKVRFRVEFFDFRAWGGEGVKIKYLDPCVKILVLESESEKGQQKMYGSESKKMNLQKLALTFLFKKWPFTLCNIVGI